MLMRLENNNFNLLDILGITSVVNFVSQHGSCGAGPQRTALQLKNMFLVIEIGTYYIFKFQR